MPNSIKIFQFKENFFTKTEDMYRQRLDASTRCRFIMTTTTTTTTIHPATVVHPATTWRSDSCSKQNEHSDVDDLQDLQKVLTSRKSVIYVLDGEIKYVSGQFTLNGRPQ